MDASELFEEVSNLRLNEGLGSAAIMTRLGGRATQSTVNKYVRRAIRAALDAGVAICPAMTPQPPPRVLGALHERIGARLLRWRLYDLPNRTGEKTLSACTFCAQTGVGNRISLRFMEEGKYDFALSELLSLATVMETTLADLLWMPAPTTQESSDSRNPGIV